MKILLAFILLSLTICDKEHLLTLSKTSSCLKDLVSSFITAEDCNRLSDHDKTKLAIKMTGCLMKEMGRSLPENCFSAESCKLQGDAWNTFSTFFAHIDNLCHFYWETLHHQRAQRLIGQLSQSSSKAEEVLRSNTEQTRKILSMQQSMHQTIENSIDLQQRMAEMINSSAMRVSNLTEQIETFVEKIQEDIDNNYASIHTLLVTISSGVNKVLEVQNYLHAQVTTISGLVYFLVIFLVILFLTSFRKYQNSRMSLLTLELLQIVFELAIWPFLSSLVGIKLLRGIFIIIMTIYLIQNSISENSLQSIIDNRLSTPRLERIISRASKRKQKEQAKDVYLSSLAMFLNKNKQEWEARKKIQVRSEEDDQEDY